MRGDIFLRKRILPTFFCAGCHWQTEQTGISDSPNLSLTPITLIAIALSVKIFFFLLHIFFPGIHEKKG